MKAINKAREASTSPAAPGWTIFPLAAILAASFAIRLPSLWIPHIENDEIIYKVLAGKFSWSLESYTLRGSELIFQGVPLLKLVPSYDKPLFHHPPLFVGLLSLVQGLGGQAAGPLLPILAGLAVIWLTYLIGRERFGETAGLCSAAILLVCPVLLLASTHLWMDGLLSALLCASYYALLRALKTGTSWRFGAAGIFWGLALLTKSTALFYGAAPLLLLIKNRAPVRRILLFLGCAGTIAAPWYALFYRTYGVFFPKWLQSSPGAPSLFPWVNDMLHRPVYFYASQLAAIMPLYLLVLPELASARNALEELPEIVWALFFLIALTTIGVWGMGFQTRYILPGLPALALLAGNFLSKQKTRILFFALTVGAYSLATGLSTVYLHPHDIEVSPLWTSTPDGR